MLVQCLCKLITRNARQLYRERTMEYPTTVARKFRKVHVTELISQFFPICGLRIDPYLFKK